MAFRECDLIAITGIGLVTPIGIGVDPFWKALHSGRCATLLPEFDAGTYTSHPQVRRMTRGIQFGLVAGEMAVRDAGLDRDDGARLQRARVVFGTTHPVTSFVEEFHQTLFEGGPGAATPMCFAVGVHNAVPFFLCDEFRLQRGSITLVGGAATGLDAIVQGCRLLSAGAADAVLTGASTEVTPTLTRIYSAMGLLSRAVPGGSIPYDRSRNGFVLSEGGVFVILERAQAAKERGARIYASVQGWSSGIFGPDRSLPEGDEGCGIYLGAANSSDLDRIEAEAIRSAPEKFGAVSNVRGHLGEGFAYTSMVQAAAAALTLHRQLAPPIVGLTDPEVDGVDYVRESRRLSVETARVGGMGFHDNSTVISLKRNV